jgi:hypothetical protein
MPIRGQPDFLASDGAAGVAGQEQIGIKKAESSLDDRSMIACQTGVDFLGWIF